MVGECSVYWCCQSNGGNYETYTWTNPTIEMPAGLRDVDQGWFRRVYTLEQQWRLNVDADGRPLSQVPQVAPPSLISQLPQTPQALARTPSVQQFLASAPQEATSPMSPVSPLSPLSQLKQLPNPFLAMQAPQLQFSQVVPVTQVVAAAPASPQLTAAQSPPSPQRQVAAAAPATPQIIAPATPLLPAAAVPARTPTSLESRALLPPAVATSASSRVVQSQLQSCAAPADLATVVNAELSPSQPVNRAPAFASRRLNNAGPR